MTIGRHATSHDIMCHSFIINNLGFVLTTFFSVYIMPSPEDNEIGPSISLKSLLTFPSFRSSALTPCSFLLVKNNSSSPKAP